jgi:hypothetical protein
LLKKCWDSDPNIRPSDAQALYDELMKFYRILSHEEGDDEFNQWRQRNSEEYEIWQQFTRDDNFRKNNPEPKQDDTIMHSNSTFFNYSDFIKENLNSSSLAADVSGNLTFL